VLAAASVALTWKVCEPWARPLYVFGLAQLANAPPSIAHWKVAPASEVKLKLAFALLLGFVGEELIVAVGACVSIVQVELAAVPVFPAASVALTWKVCEPSASAEYAFGLEQLANAPPSSAHWNVAPASEVKLKLAFALLLGFVGEALIVAVGATVSIVQVELAAVPALPAASTALTWKVCEPSARPVYAFGLEQLANAPPSSAHVNVAPSSELKLKDALALLLGFVGAAEIVAAGATVSIVHVKLAGALALPAASVALTWKVWLPSATPE
jgi:2C-methyl-D-erythritol 2,4-cyclodiphosphate synthase